MPSYKPINRAADLPRLGEVAEHDTLDFKVTYSPDKGEEMAKDMAAFANHLGGVLLIGAEEGGDGRLAPYRPLQEEFAGRLKTAFENAARNKCSPRPLVTVVPISYQGGTLLAVNVEPMIGGVVGVNYGRDAYHFPVRRASQTAPIAPENLPMYMLPELRRIVLLLNKIQGRPGIRVLHSKQSSARNTSSVDDWWDRGKLNCRVVEVSPEGNFVTFKDDSGGYDVLHGIAPLDAVETVFIRGESSLHAQGTPFAEVRLKPGHTIA